MLRYATILAFGVATFFQAGRHVSAADPKVTKTTWEGTMKVNDSVSLRLVLNLNRSDDGEVTATFESPDQGASGMPVKTAAIDKQKLTFAMPDLGISYEGMLNAKGDEAVGTFSQGGGKFPLTLKKAAADAPVTINGKEQVWEGKLSVGAGMQLRLVFHLLKDDAGKYTGTFDSPDQAAKSLKLDSVTVEKRKMIFEAKALGAKYEGKVDQSGTEAVGEWSQGEAKIPLTIKLVANATEAKRPQTPKPPFPYKNEFVSYSNKAGKVNLAGTLTIPQGKGPFPAAIMISGSGSQDRDETLFEHKPFMLIADTLTRRGVAVLRLDDRGVGGSTGTPATSTTDDYAGDVLAGVQYLKTRPEINGKKIGLIGHSEGGVIAPIVATRSTDVAFIVMMAGTGLPGDEIIYLQGGLIAKSLGAAEPLLGWNKKAQKRLVEIVKSEPDNAKAHAKLTAAVKDLVAEHPDQKPKTREVVGEVLAAQLKTLESPWFRYFLTFDPRPTLQKVKCPVLALVGEKDLQVPPQENLTEIERALKKGGNTRVTVKELTGLNHLFQTCQAGSPSEYARIEETVSPLALKAIGDWVTEQVGK